MEKSPRKWEIWKCATVASHFECFSIQIVVMFFLICHMLSFFRCSHDVVIVTSSQVSGTAQVFGWPRSEVGRTLHVAMVWGSWAHLEWKGCHRMSQGRGTNMVTWSHLPWRKLTELQFGLAQHHIETDSHGIILYIPTTILKAYAYSIRLNAMGQMVKCAENLSMGQVESFGC